MQLALRHQGVAVPAVVALLVQEQHFQGALRLGPFLEGNRQGDIGRAEADTDEIVNHGGCSCLSHFQFLWIGPLSSGSDKSRAALEGHLLTRNEDREMKFKRCRARIAKSVGFPFAHAHPTVLHRVDDVLFHQAAGNIEMFGDLRMGQAVQLAQQEGTAADGRQLGQGARCRLSRRCPWSTTVCGEGLARPSSSSRTSRGSARRTRLRRCSSTARLSAVRYRKAFGCSICA